jgi:hypothetical protein
MRRWTTSDKVRWLVGFVVFAWLIDLIKQIVRT